MQWTNWMAREPIPSPPKNFSPIFDTAVDDAETIDALLEIDILLPDSLKYDELSTTL